MTEKFNAANTSFLLGKSYRRKVFLVNLYMLSNTLLDPNILSRVDKNSSEYNGEKLAEKEGDEENLFRLLKTEEGDKHLLSMKKVLLDEYGGSIEKLKEAFKSTDNSDKDDIENYFSEIKEKAPKKEVEKEYYGINTKKYTWNKPWEPEFIVVNPERPYIKGTVDAGGAYTGTDIITGKKLVEIMPYHVEYLPKKEAEKTIELLKEAKKKKDDEAAEAEEPGAGDGAEATAAPGAKGAETPAAAAAVAAAAVEGAKDDSVAKGKPVSGEEGAATEVKPVEGDGAAAQGVDGVTEAVNEAEQQREEIEKQKQMEENYNREALEKKIQDEEEAAEKRDASLKTRKNNDKTRLQNRLTRKKQKREVQKSDNKFKKNLATREKAKETAKNLVGKLLPTPPQSSDSKGDRRTNKNIGNKLTSLEDSNLNTQQNKPQRRNSTRNGGSRKK